MTTSFRTPVPAGFQFSAETKKLIKKRDELTKTLAEYRSKNADCQRVNRTPYQPHNPTYVVPAIVAAERQLKDLEIQAIDAGKPLPDKDEFLAPVKARVAEYQRMVPALTGAVQAATEAVDNSIQKDMPSLAKQSLNEANKAQVEYRDALEKTEAARAKMSGSVDRFLWSVSEGVLNAPMGRGWDGNMEDDVNAWETDGNGRITAECARTLGLVTTYSGDLVALPEFVADDDNDSAESTTPFHSGRLNFSGAAWSASLGRFV
ncbi:hypothetical protein ACFYRD_18285 [Streptomyces hirsutus]|uniref:hypothetical protein n=1 Tax=Streptomyces hirsutus TaxID=35620 RepID=UPI0036CF9BCB